MAVRRQKREDLKKQREEEQLRECTFKPQISKMKVPLLHVDVKNGGASTRLSFFTGDNIEAKVSAFAERLSKRL